MTGGRWPTGLKITYAVAGVLLVVAGILAVVSLHKASPPPSTTVTTSPHGGSTPPTTAAAGPLSGGQQGTFSQIPWSEVGHDWFLALAAPPSGNGGASLFVVDPTGGRYFIMTMATGGNAALLSWSGDAQRALLLYGSTVMVVDLTSGQVDEQFQLSAPPVADPSFTFPRGLDLLLDSVAAGRTELERVSLEGSLELGYPHSFGHLGGYAGAWLETPDGTEIALGATGGVALVSNAGAVLGSLAVPGVSGCEPLRWWESGVVLTECAGSSGPGLWLVPLNGAAPTELTTTAGGGNAPVDAWRLSSGVYAEESTGTSACAPSFVGGISSAGAVSAVTVPGLTTGTTVEIVGADATRLALLEYAGCPAQGATASLSWFDPSTGATVPLLGPPMTGPSVLAALPFPAVGS